MGCIEEVKKKDKLLAMIIRNDYACNGVDFITPNKYSQQVAYMHHPKGKVIDAHVHNLVHRNVVMTQEVLFIKKGILRVDFYDEYEDYLESRNLKAGDIILLVSGGHASITSLSPLTRLSWPSGFTATMPQPCCPLCWRACRP